MDIFLKDPRTHKDLQFSKFLKLYPQSETQKSNPTFGENVGNMRQYKGTKYEANITLYEHLKWLDKIRHKHKR